MLPVRPAAPCTSHRPTMPAPGILLRPSTMQRPCGPIAPPGPMARATPGTQSAVRRCTRSPSPIGRHSSRTSSRDRSRRRIRSRGHSRNRISNRGRNRTPWSGHRHSLSLGRASLPASGLQGRKCKCTLRPRRVARPSTLSSTVAVSGRTNRRRRRTTTGSRQPDRRSPALGHPRVDGLVARRSGVPHRGRWSCLGPDHSDSWILPLT